MADSGMTAPINEITSGVEKIGLTDDFHLVNVFPAASDVIDVLKPVLRPNKIRGKYASVDEYLDTQFRLLREDFYGPLRDGIAQFRQEKKMTNQHLFVYFDVSFVPNHRSSNNRCIYVVTFPHFPGQLKDVDQRFRYGSLLCLTADYFATMLFATVLDFPPRTDYQKQPRVEIHLDPKVKFDASIFHRKYVMVESKQYYEPYKQVLQTMQNISPECPFPLEECILNAKRDVDIPCYLWPMVDPTPGVLTSAPEFQTFDESQKKAFEFAMTKELAIIQGPPGTGKTFIGLKITEELLKLARTEKSPPPILVVCFTNHALDQFLEGIVEQDLSSDVVRLGGMSKSEPLENYLLSKKRRIGKTATSMAPFYDELCSVSHDLRDLQTDIFRLSEKQGILSITTISELQAYDYESFILPEFSFRPFEVRHELSDGLFMTWLYGSKSPGSDKTFSLPGTDSMEGNLNQPVASEKSRVMYAFKFDDARERIEELRRLLEANSQCLNDEIKELWVKEFRCQSAQLQFMMHSLNGKRQPVSQHTLQNLLKTTKVWQMPLEHRWDLYFHWEAQVNANLLYETHELEERHHAANAMVQDARMSSDTRLLRHTEVIGMTTSSAARLYEMMESLRIRTVIVEEAAEVLEGHLVTSLTKFCQHLILIGDHQQLRPKTAVHELARSYGLDVSLFERLLNNDLPCVTLQVQHRMRPEIARLIAPTIYPQLTNHPSVFGREDVMGVNNNVFFINHDKPEEKRSAIHTTSYLNPHEGDMLLALCRHLVQQGYMQKQITIITTYADQVTYLIENRDKCEDIKGVRVSSVDGYQGEENDIILLSLVRSNEEDNIGFLKTPNRVCVALSRARRGLYIIGNMSNLVNVNCIWREIMQTLTNHNSVGSHLTLRCQNHPDQLTKVASAEDFKKISGGGCLKPCEMVMKCYHTCKQTCHVIDTLHRTEKYMCKMRCARDYKDCVLGHQCGQLCWQTCDFCPVPVEYSLPCGHVAILSCKETFVFEEYTCRAIVTKTQPCGHESHRPCSAVTQKLPYRCAVVADNLLPCGHTAMVPCNKRQHKCMKPVIATFPWCGHLVLKMCYKDVNDCQCKQACRNWLTCGHKCPLKCHKVLEPHEPKYKNSCSNSSSGDRLCSLPACTAEYIKTLANKGKLSSKHGSRITTQRSSQKGNHKN